MPESMPITAAERPIVSDVQDGPLGRFFTVEFAPGQSLLTHRNPATVVITALGGGGDITIAGEGTRALPAGAVVQLAPDVEHAVVAGEDGLELRVDLIASCCSRC